MTLSNRIGGHAEAPALELAPAVCDANDGRELFRQRASSSEQVGRAVTLAARTHAEREWTAQPAAERAALLDKVAEKVLARSEAIAQADAQATGVVISLTRKLAQVCAAAFRQGAELVRHPPATAVREGPHGPLAIERLPLGPAAVIAPWNAPAGIAAHKVASALAAGCPVLLKPSEWAPLSGQLIAEAALEAGIPGGMLQLLHGGAETGAALASDPRVRAVSFTGGLAGGRAVAAACAKDIKPAQLELGGNNPLVVLEDANLDVAADGVVTGLITLNGQWCRALGRLLVHAAQVEPLLDRVRQRLQQVRVGSSLDEKSEMGPLVSRRHRDHVAARVREMEAKGGKLHRPTKLPDLPGWFHAPTLITGLAPEDTLEEVFGPVAAVHTFRDDAEAVALANQPPFGLAAYVFGEERHAWQVAREVRAGLIKINAVTLLNLHPQAPRPAWGLSGLGDEGTVETFEFFRGTRVTGVAARPGAAT